MDIRLNAYSAYKTNGVSGFQKKGENSIASAATQKDGYLRDVVSISNSANGKSAISKASSSIRADINALSSTDRVSALREQIKNGSYSVSTEDIAGAILERFI